MVFLIKEHFSHTHLWKIPTISLSFNGITSIRFFSFLLWKLHFIMHLTCCYMSKLIKLWPIFLRETLDISLQGTFLPKTSLGNFYKFYEFQCLQSPWQLRYFLKMPYVIIERGMISRNPLIFWENIERWPMTFLSEEHFCHWKHQRIP